MPETQSVVCIILLFYFKIVATLQLKAGHCFFLNNHITEVPGEEIRGREAALVVPPSHLLTVPHKTGTLSLRRC